MNNLFSKLANNRSLTKVVILTAAGIGTVCNLFMVVGSYLLGVNSGVETRDEYYLKKEIGNYEGQSKCDETNKDGV